MIENKRSYKERETDMSEEEQRRQLEEMAKHVLKEDLELVIRIMRDFQARWMNEAYKKGAA